MTVFTPLIGRFGNQMFQYAHARAYANQNGHTLVTPKWMGQQLFDLPPQEIGNLGDETISDYCQSQSHLIYSRQEARQWFRFKPELASRAPKLPCVAHRRAGDYERLGYVVVSKKSYLEAAKQFSLPDSEFITEECPHQIGGVPTEPNWIADFLLMARAEILLRGNSTFSWWAATLSNARVFSPIIEGKPGGKEHDCEFTEGNWPRFCDLYFVTDLHLPEIPIPPATEEKRYEYPLGPNSVVWDCGAFDGEFAKRLAAKYNCRVLMFEPIDHCDFSKISKANPRLKRYSVAIGGRSENKMFSIQNDSSGQFGTSGPKTEVRVLSVLDAMTLTGCRGGDLLKINIEGMEYELLEHLIENDLCKCFDNIQVQFHTNAPDWKIRLAKIHAGLNRTHNVTWGTHMMLHVNWKRK